MEREEQRRIAEALILGSPEPVSAQRLAEIVPGVRAAQVADLVGEINAEYARQRRAFEVVEAAGGFQLRTLAEFGPYLQQTLSARPLRLSQAALETLSVIAYKQPISRGAVASIRAVNVDSVVRTLLSRGLITEVSTEAQTGAILYGTTDLLLTQLGINSLDELPQISPLLEDGSDGFDETGTTR